MLKSVDNPELLKKKLYKQALDCFERAKCFANSNEVLNCINECEAEIQCENGNYEDAVKLFLSIPKPDKAAQCYDNMGLYDKAAQIYYTKKYCKDPYPLYRTYMIKYYDSINQWERSAIYCKQIGAYKEAFIRFQKAGKYRDADLVKRYFE